MTIDLMQEAQTLAHVIAQDRHYLHAHAETGFDLNDTFDYVWKTLTDMGLTPRKVGRCGITADVGVGTPCTLLRADMDALPLTENSGEPFSCAAGRMHACGHDIHTAMLLGAARILKARENELPGAVRLMFQPSEETLEGASDMLQNGLLDGAEIRQAAMIHVLTGLEIPVGTCIVSAPGVSAPAADMFRIDIQGKGCHGAMPNMGIDPITAGAHIVTGLMAINARELGLNDAAALTIGSFSAGEGCNVIPDTAALMGSMRSFSDETEREMLSRAEAIARCTAMAHRCEAAFTRLSSTPTLLNDKAVSENVHAALTELLGSRAVIRSDAVTGSASRSSGSEDFAYISHAAPSVMIALAAGRPQDGFDKPAHHPAVRFDEAAMPVGAAVYAAIGMMNAQS